MGGEKGKYSNLSGEGMVPCTALRKPKKRGKVRRQTYDEILSKSEERSIDLRHEQPNVTNYGCKPSLFSSVFAL